MRRAIAATDTARLAPEARGWLRALRRALAVGVSAADPGASPEPGADPAAGEPAWTGAAEPGPDRASGGRGGAGSALEPARGVEVAAGVRGATTPRLDPLRPLAADPERTEAWPWATVGAWLEAGPVTALIRVRSDAWFPDDPDGEDIGRRLEARAEEGWLAARLRPGGPRAEIFLGRLARSWGPPSVGGPALVVSDNPASYAHLGLELAAGPFAFRSLLAGLDTIADARRWLSAHHLEWRAADGLRLALVESIVWAGDGLGLGPRMLNPASPFFFEHTDRPEDFRSNVLIGLQYWWQRPGFVLTGELVIDDFTYSDPTGTGEGAPPRYAFRAGLALPRLVPRSTLRLEYRQLSSFVFRAQLHEDDHLHLGRGLGDNFADFDRLDLTLELYPVPGLTLTPAFHLLRQGEGDPRTPIPSLAPDPEAADSVFLASSALFLGTRTDTYRAALAGRWAPHPLAFVAWDLGINFVEDEAHVPGRSATRFAGFAELGLRWEF